MKNNILHTKGIMNILMFLILYIKNETILLKDQNPNILQ